MSRLRIVLQRLVRRWMCRIGRHAWEWYLPNGTGTIVGTQWCQRCQALRGVFVKPNNSITGGR